MKKIILFALMNLSMGTLKATTIIVQNTNNSSVGSLRQAIIDANDGDTIRFNPSLIGSGNATISLSSEIEFSKLLTFKGLYNSTDTLYLSGSNTNRIFRITDAAKSTIDSMVLINGNASSANGGAISFEGVDSVFISNSRFNNSIAYGGGGAISHNTNANNSGPASNSFFNLNNSVISNNSASIYGGGGIFFGGSNVTLMVNNSAFTDNSASDNSGGGIYAFTFYGGSVTIENSDINNNDAHVNGGGLYVESFYFDFFTTINNTTIDNNDAVGTGGGIYSGPKEISTVILNNTTISNNSADKAGGLHSGDFSASASQSFVNLTNSTVTGNHANNDYGGIASSAVTSHFTATNSTIYGNTTATSSNKCSGVFVFGYEATSSLEFTSSIVSSSSSENIKHLIVAGGGSITNSSDPIITGGYNIFSNAPNGANGTGDLINVSEVALDLQVLADYGGSNFTMQPGLASVALNAGNPSDLSDAQNTPIVGIRDIGSAEGCSQNCGILVTSIDVQGQSGVSSITTQGGTLQMEATVLPANADDVTYTWSVTNGTGAATISTTGLLTATADGTVDVIATANDASGVTGSVTITISNQTAGINENEVAELVKIYPNPVQNQLFVEVDNTQIIEMNIIDLSGNAVKSITNSTVDRIDVSDLTKGIYLLKIQTESGISTRRFIKQ